MLIRFRDFHYLPNVRYIEQRSLQIWVVENAFTSLHYVSQPYSRARVTQDGKLRAD